MKEGVDVFANLLVQEGKLIKLKQHENAVLSDTLRNTEEFIVAMDKQVSKARQNQGLIQYLGNNNQSFVNGMGAMINQRENHKQELGYLVSYLLQIEQ